MLANFIVQPVKRVITFAKLIPDFRRRDIVDQMNLLKGSTMEITICSSSTLYDEGENRFVNVISKDRQLAESSVPAASSNIQLDIMRLIWSPEVFEKTLAFLRSMSELRIDEATLILFLPCILFAPDRREITDRRLVCALQSKYSFLLKKYMHWKYGKSAADKLYAKLMLKLIELRSLREMHRYVETE